MKMKSIFTIFFLHLTLFGFAEKQLAKVSEYQNTNRNDFFDLKCRGSVPFSFEKTKNNCFFGNLPTETPVNNYKNTIEQTFRFTHLQNAQYQKQPNFAHNTSYSNYSTPTKGYESVLVKSNVNFLHSITSKTVHSYENPQFEHSSKDFSKHKGGNSHPSSWNAEQRTTQNGQQTVSFENKSKHDSNAQFIVRGVEDNEGRVKVPQLRKGGLSYKTPFEIVP